MRYFFWKKKFGPQSGFLAPYRGQSCTACPQNWALWVKFAFMLSNWQKRTTGFVFFYLHSWLFRSKKCVFYGAKGQKKVVSLFWLLVHFCLHKRVNFFLKNGRLVLSFFPFILEKSGRLVFYLLIFTKKTDDWFCPFLPPLLKKVDDLFCALHNSNF